MNTSVFPPSRLASFIRCVGSQCPQGITLGESYYTLVNITNEAYQFTLPVTWNANDNDVPHNYTCLVRFSGIAEDGVGPSLNDKNKNIIAKGLLMKILSDVCFQLFYIIASSPPTSVSHEVVNATAIRVSWSITGSVNGFVIYTSSNGLNTVTEQLTDSTLKEYIVNGLLPERNYTIQVRGYYQLLGPANTITVRLEGIVLNRNEWIIIVDC